MNRPWSGPKRLRIRRRWQALQRRRAEHRGQTERHGQTERARRRPPGRSRRPRLPARPAPRLRCAGRGPGGCVSPPNQQERPRLLANRRADPDRRRAPRFSARQCRRQLSSPRSGCRSAPVPCAARSPGCRGPNAPGQDPGEAAGPRSGAGTGRAALPTGERPRGVSYTPRLPTPSDHPSADGRRGNHLRSVRSAGANRSRKGP